MLTTDDSGLAEAANRLRNHGASVSEEIRHYGPKPYLLPDFDVLGFNYRMSDLQGALGLVQLGKLDSFIAERDKWARWYCDALADIKWLQMPSVPAGYGHAWQSFVTVVDEASAPAPRNDIMEALQEAGISTRPGTHAVTELGYYKDHLELQSGQFKVASRLERQTLALPLHNRMSAEDFTYVSETLHGI